MNNDSLKDWLELPEGAEFESLLHDLISKNTVNLRGHVEIGNYRFADGFISGLEETLELISQIKRSELNV